MPQDKQCKHSWTYLGKGDDWKYCSKCRTPFTPTSPKSDWRNNILKTLGYDLNDEINIPGSLLNAIDAAYTAGLDDREKVVSKTEEEILKEFDDTFLMEEGIRLRDIDVSIYAYKVKHLLSQAFKAGEALGQQNGMRNIGMLRQWLNEKPADRLVTNEDIEHWLNLK